MREIKGGVQIDILGKTLLFILQIGITSQYWPFQIFGKVKCGEK